MFWQLVVINTSTILLLLDIQSTDPAWYQLLVSQLTEEHKKELEDVFRLAEQKRAAAGQQLYAVVCNCNVADISQGSVVTRLVLQ